MRFSTPFSSEIAFRSKFYTWNHFQLHRPLYWADRPVIYPMKQLKRSKSAAFHCNRRGKVWPTFLGQDGTLQILAGLTAPLVSQSMINPMKWTVSPDVPLTITSDHCLRLLFDHHSTDRRSVQKFFILNFFYIIS